MKRKRRSRKPPRRRNAAAAALASPLFRARRIAARKGKGAYSRKKGKAWLRGSEGKSENGDSTGGND